MYESHFIDFSPIPQFVLDSEHRIVRWNHPCVALTGFAADDMLGTKNQWKPFYPTPRPTLADSLMDTRDSMELCTASGTMTRSEVVPGAWEMTIETEVKKGRRQLHCIASLIRDSEGRVTGAVESIQDITSQMQIEAELKQSNEDYRTLAENFPQGFLVAQDGKLVLVNRAFANMLGYPSPDSVIGVEACDLIAESDREEFKRHLESVLKGNSPLSKRQRPHLTRDGREVWLEGHPRRITWRGRTALLSTLVDITETRQREMLALEKSSRLRGRENILEFNIQDRYRLGDIIGKSEAMRKVYGLVLKSAARHENVIIMGESGTGKEVVAKTIHDLSPGSEHRFIPVNCGAIPAELLESEFFGYKKGAFTGAYADKPGYLAEANEGTLFLDEVGELPLGMQVKLLRVLDNSTYSPLGSAEVKRSRVRVIAATNQDLMQQVKTGRMREDFFFRLYIMPIRLPPLRERKEDIPLLVDHFVSQNGHSSQSSSFIPGYVLDALYRYDWPGNVRELQNTIQRFMTMGVLDLVRSDAADHKQGVRGEGNSPEDNLRRMLARYETQLIGEALRKANGNRSRAASILGISRKTFYRKIEKRDASDP